MWPKNQVSLGHWPKSFGIVMVLVEGWQYEIVVHNEMYMNYLPTKMYISPMYIRKGMAAQ